MFVVIPYAICAKDDWAVTNMDLLDMKPENKPYITLWTVTKKDIIPWLLSAAFILLIFVGVISLINATGGKDNNFLNASAMLYANTMPLYWGLIVLACLAARRSADKWTWILAAILIFFFVPQGSITIAMKLLPNSILPALIAMLGLLSIARIVEYVQVRNFLDVKVIDSRSDAVVVPYALVALVAFVFTSPLFA